MTEGAARCVDAARVAILVPEDDDIVKAGKHELPRLVSAELEQQCAAGS